MMILGYSTYKAGESYQVCMKISDQAHSFCIGPENEEGSLEVWSPEQDLMRIFREYYGLDKKTARQAASRMTGIVLGSTEEVQRGETEISEDT